MHRLFLLLITLAAVNMAASADLSQKEKAAAKALYIAKCAKCHRMYEPSTYSEEDWRTWLQKMNRKSKLKPDDEKLLTRYLDEYRASRKKQ